MAVPEAVVTWLRQNAVPFDAIEPGGGLTDLLPLKAMIGDARIVGLGEATHGSHEFFAMKHRILELLVQEMGFDTFAIEANAPECQLIDDYVQTGEGDARQLVKGMGFWTWDTQEVVELVRWMRRYNEKHSAGRLSYRGFDLQSPIKAMDNVLDFLARVDADARAEAERLYEPLRSSYPSRTTPRADWYFRRPRRFKRSCRDGVHRVSDGLRDRWITYREATTDEDVRSAFDNAQLAIDGQAFLDDVFSEIALYGVSLRSPRTFLALFRLLSRMRFGLSDFRGVRDKQMTGRVEGLLAPERRNKVALWAHNGHVMRRRGWLGGYLGAMLGPNYVSIAFAFHAGGCVALSMDGSGRTTSLAVHELEARPSGSIEEACAAIDRPRFIVDLRNLPPGSEVARWFNASHRMAFVGAGVNPRAKHASSVRVRLAKETDILIYCHKIRAADSLSEWLHRSASMA